MRARAVIASLAGALALGGCQFPADPDGTLERVKGGTMRVGITHAPPWVEIDSEGNPIGGIEVELAKRFARDVGVKRIEWIDGSEEELVNSAKEGSLDLVIGGITKKSRWKKDVAFTQPYAETEISIGQKPGSNLPDDLDGVRAYAESGSEAEALLHRKTEAEVVTVSKLSKGHAPVAAEEFVMDDLGVVPTRELLEEAHVMALPFGENAWMVRLERFLLNRDKEIERLITEEGKP
jgi:polar amino acid transport system substrate-binding protein